MVAMFLRAWLFLFAKILAPFGCVMSIVLIIFGVREVSRASESKTWPVVQGQIIRSEMVFHHSGSDTGENGHEAFIEYGYKVGNRDFTSRRRAFIWFKYSGEKTARAIVAKYPKGAAVAVHYRADDPSAAVLEPGVTFQVATEPLMGVLGVVLCILIFRFLPGLVQNRLAMYAREE